MQQVVVYVLQPTNRLGNTLNTSRTSISARAFRIPAVFPASRGEEVETETLSADVSPAAIGGETGEGNVIIVVRHLFLE